MPGRSIVLIEQNQNRLQEVWVLNRLGQVVTNLELKAKTLETCFSGTYFASDSPMILARLLSILVIVMPALPSVGHSATLCADFFADRDSFAYFEDLTSSLQRKGYSTDVAARIARLSPELAEKISNERMASNRAVRLYRGLRVPLSKVNFKGKSGSTKWNSTKGVTWFSLDYLKAIGFAKGGPHAYTSLIEVEVPRYFFTLAARLDLWKGYTQARLEATFPNGTIDRKSLPDMTPFINRVGIVGINPLTKRMDISWFSYEEALQLGLFNDTTDYAEGRTPNPYFVKQPKFGNSGANRYHFFELRFLAPTLCFKSHRSSVHDSSS